MGPRDWIETIKEVVKKIGNTGDTGGSQTAGTVFGKENAILESIQNAMQRGMVRNIQRGTLILNQAQPLNVSLFGFTDLNKMVAFANGLSQIGAGGPTIFYMYISGLSVDTLNFKCAGDKNWTAQQYINYTVVEFW